MSIHDHERDLGPQFQRFLSGVGARRPSRRTLRHAWWLSPGIEASLWRATQAGRRLLRRLDFQFGYPKGTARTTSHRLLQLGTGRCDGGDVTVRESHARPGASRRPTTRPEPCRRQWLRPVVRSRRPQPVRHPGLTGHPGCRGVQQRSSREHRDPGSRPREERFVLPSSCRRFYRDRSSELLPARAAARLDRNAPEKRNNDALRTLRRTPASLTPSNVWSFS